MHALVEAIVEAIHRGWGRRADRARRRGRPRRARSTFVPAGHDAAVAY